MKTSAFVIAASIASASAFVPSTQAPKTFALNGIFEKIADMDLFAPDKDVNTYGARNRKKAGTVGKINDNSYIPAGLTAAEYEKVRNGDAAKKAANYQRNVNKAGVFEDYTEFYVKRGTDTGESWNKGPTKGHRMAKTKFDWSGGKDAPAQVGLAAKNKGKK